VLCDSSTPLIQDCRFDHDMGTNEGGAIHATLATGQFSLIDCVFSENTAASQGGAVYARLTQEIANFHLVRCTLSQNIADSGGAIKVSGLGHRTFTDCTFDRNSAIDPNGGGGALDSCVAVCVGLEISTGSQTWTNCQFLNNTSARHGGAMFVTNSDASF